MFFTVQYKADTQEVINLFLHQVYTYMYVKDKGDFFFENPLILKFIHLEIGYTLIVSQKWL